MKKITITILFVLSTILLISQTNFSVAVSDKLSFSDIKIERNQFDFPEPKDIELTTILVSDSKIEVVSNVNQFYEFISEEKKPLDNSGSYWLAQDSLGGICRVYLFKNEYSELLFGVEYTDCAWIYILTVVE